MALLPMTKTLLKNLFSAPATEAYPFGPKEICRGSRGKVAIEIEKCIFCSLCQKKCPTNALRVDRTGKEWAIDRLRCISCGACVDVCPKKCLMLETAYSSATEGAQVDLFKAPAGAK